VVTKLALRQIFSDIQKKIGAISPRQIPCYLLPFNKVEPAQRDSNELKLAKHAQKDDAIAKKM
jgi:hypothetical protein